MDGHQTLGIERYPQYEFSCYTRQTVSTDKAIYRLIKNAPSPVATDVRSCYRRSTPTRLSTHRVVVGITSMSPRGTLPSGDIFDVGVAHFHGTMREPLLVRRTDDDNTTVLVLGYDAIDQTPIDLQATTGSLL